MAQMIFHEAMRLDSSGNIGIGSFPQRSKNILDFTVYEDGSGYTVIAGSGDATTVKTYEEVEALFRLRFAEWKLERD